MYACLKVAIIILNFGMTELKLSIVLRKLFASARQVSKSGKRSLLLLHGIICGHEQ